MINHVLFELLLLEIARIVVIIILLLMLLFEAICRMEFLRIQKTIRRPKRSALALFFQLLFLLDIRLVNGFFARLLKHLLIVELFLYEAYLFGLASFFFFALQANKLLLLAPLQLTRQYDLFFALDVVRLTIAVAIAQR